MLYHLKSQCISGNIDLANISPLENKMQHRNTLDI